MTEQKFKTLKAICGAVFYTMLKNNEREISAWEWSRITGYLDLDVHTIYSIEILPNGFQLATKKLTMKYTHNDFSFDNRRIEITG